MRDELADLKRQIFAESQWHRHHSDEVAEWHNQAMAWHKRPFVNHYNCVALNLEDLQLHIDTVSTQIVALCARSSIENYIIVKYLAVDKNGSAQAEYDGSGLVGLREAFEAGVSLLVSVGAMTEEKAIKEKDQFSKSVIEKAKEMKVPELKKKPDINWREWAEALGEKELIADRENIHTLTSKFVHPTPTSSDMMQPNANREWLHQICGITALKYSRKVREVVDEVLKPKA